MAATIKGVGIVWGIQGLNFTAGIVSNMTVTPPTGAGSAYPQSYTYTQSATIQKIKDGKGDTTAAVFSDPTKTWRITVVPSGATLALAKASAVAWVPVPGLAITFTDADGAPAGNAYVVSCTLNRTNEGQATADLELEAVAADITTTISA